MEKECRRCKVVTDKLIHSKIVWDMLCKECTTLLDYEVEALALKFVHPEPMTEEEKGFFPPPWDFVKYPEKTEGWLEFQKEMRKHPSYYHGDYSRYC